MKQSLTVLIIVLVLIAGWLLLKKAPSTTTVSPNTTTQAPNTQQQAPRNTRSSLDVGASVQGTVTTPKTQNVAVSIVNFAFSPTTVTIAAGDTVTWKQQDSAPHSVVADGGSFASATLSSGQTYSHTFTKPGTYTYYCGLHPAMKGTIIVK